MLPKYKERTNSNKKSFQGSTDKLSNQRFKHKKGKTNTKSNSNNWTKKSNSISKCKKSSI